MKTEMQDWLSKQHYRQSYIDLCDKRKKIIDDLVKVKEAGKK